RARACADSENRGNDAHANQPTRAQLPPGSSVHAVTPCPPSDEAPGSGRAEPTPTVGRLQQASEHRWRRPGKAAHARSSSPRTAGTRTARRNNARPGFPGPAVVLSELKASG